MRPRLWLAALLLCPLTVRAEGGAPEDRFFDEAGGVVAQYHFAGPANPPQNAWLRRDGRVLLRGKRGGPGPPDLDGDPSSPAPQGWTWREATIDVALIKKIERLARQSGVCKARSTDGFSVGGAWVVAVDFGAGLRCSVRRRARLEVERPIARLRDAITAALDAAQRATPLHEGRRADPWDLGARAPL